MNDKRSGYGKFKWKDGGTYEGGWLDGRQHGQGTVRKADGTIMKGLWDKGKNLDKVKVEVP